MQDLMAGFTVAAVALPLALAFGVSSGVDASAGLITAIIGGIVIGALSGASYQISGPTGAMAVILISLSNHYGIDGVLLAGLISGILLLIMAILQLGKLVSFIPISVISGFTSGIAIIIALGQINNFFGNFKDSKNIIFTFSNFNIDYISLLFGLLTILIIIFCPKKIQKYIPSSLIAIIIVVLINIFFNKTPVVKEVGAIPKTLISENGLIFNISNLDLKNIKHLIEPAFSIAILGLIESLLCGASAGIIKGEKLNSTRELFAQGIGNIIIPFFGGIPATAAIARTSVVIKSGGQTRLASIFHSIVLIASMFLLGNIMSRIPLSSLAGVLIVTAFKMNDWKNIKSLFTKKMKTPLIQFLLTMISTVIFDLSIAILIGVVVSMLIFVLNSCNLKITISDVDKTRFKNKNFDKNIKVVYLTGPLFFGTQEQLTKNLENLDNLDGIIFSMRGVPSIDDSGINELEHLIKNFKKTNTTVMFSGIQENVQYMFEKSGFIEKVGKEYFVWDALIAIQKLIDN